jgi:3',5'-cyclic AMP phosphodiesterase CpdA
MKPLRFAQISDLHFTKLTVNPFRLFSKRLLGIINWFFTRRSVFSKSQIFAIPELLKSLQIDRILLCGDFTTTALYSEYEEAVKFVELLPAPWLAIPGNHDHYTQTAYHQKHFYRYLANAKEITHKTGFFNLKEHGVEAHQQKDTTWWIVLLDTACATWTNSARGLFSVETERNLIEILSLIPSDHSILLVNHYPFFQHDTPRHNLGRGEVLESILKQNTRIKAYLHGHTHHHLTANLQPIGLPVVLDSGCCADKRKGSWNVITLDDQGIQIATYLWVNGWTLSHTEKFIWTR